MPGPGCRAREGHFRAEAWSASDPQDGWVPGHEERRKAWRQDVMTHVGGQQALETQMGATLPLVSPSLPHFPPGGCVVLERSAIIKNNSRDPKVPKAFSWPGPWGCLAPRREGRAVGEELAVLCEPAGALAVGALQLSRGVQGGWPQWETLGLGVGVLFPWQRLSLSLWDPAPWCHQQQPHPGLMAQPPLPCPPPGPYSTLWHFPELAMPATLPAFGPMGPWACKTPSSLPLRLATHLSTQVPASFRSLPGPPRGCTAHLLP